MTEIQYEKVFQGDFEDKLHVGLVDNEIAIRAHDSERVGYTILSSGQTQELETHLEKLRQIQKAKNNEEDITDAIGRKIVSVYVNSEMINLNFADGGYIQLYHEQDCCESVWLENHKEVGEELKRMVGQTIRVFKERTTHSVGGYSDSVTCTFYTIRTDMESCDFMFRGESNGYYSERVDIDIGAPTPQTSDSINF